VIASWCMKTTMNQPEKAVIPAPGLRQAMLEFEGAGRWLEFPEADRNACLEALARLLCLTITGKPEEDENER
jgi:hypothetical protein